MSQAQMESKATTAESETKHMLPDGVGLRLEQVQAMLATQHNSAIPKDDPILMIVTICNAFLGEVQTLHQRHEAGLSKLMADKTDAYVRGVRESTAQLTTSLSSASMEKFKDACQTQEKSLSVFKRNLSWLAAIVGVAALVNVAVYTMAGRL